MFAEQLRDHDETPTDDRIVVLRGATWADYQRHLEMRGESPVPRIAFLENTLELMTPSRPHESLKSRIGCLVEVWCLENGIEFSTYGSWTLENKPKQGGLEPDECYVFGEDADPARPHLAIEVIWTSGSLDKLEIYQRLGVREVWFWRRGRISAHVLHDNTYQEVAESEHLPGINLEELASFLDRPTTSQAIRDYRERVISSCSTARSREDLPP